MHLSPTRGGGLYERKSAISLSYAAKSLQAQTLINKISQTNQKQVEEEIVVSKQFLYSNYWYQQQDLAQFSHSAVDVGDILNQIMKSAAKMLMDKHYTTLLPKFTVDKIFEPIEENFEANNMKEDQCDHHAQEDQEPISQGDEHWASFRVEVGTKYIKQSINLSNQNQSKIHQLARRASRVNTPSHSQFQSTQNIRRRDSNYSNHGENQKGKDTPQQLFKKSTEQDKIEQIRLDGIHETEQVDLLENGLRMAYEHEVQLQAQRERQQRLREEELKEHNKYMKQIQGANQGKKQFTYDFEGKILVQNGLNYDKMQQTQQTPQFNIQLISTNNLKASDIDLNDKQQKVANNKRDKKDYVSSVDIIKNISSVSQIDNIVLNKGVTFYEGNNTKSGPNFNVNNFDFEDSLQNPQLGLKLSRCQYEKLIRKVSFQNSMTKNSKIQFEHNSSMISIENGPTDASIIPKDFLQQQSKRTNVNLTSFSIGRVHGGSIRYSQDSGVGLDDLLIQDQQPRDYKLPTLPTPPTQKYKDNLDYIMNVTQEPLTRKDEKSKPSPNLKLPLKLSAANSLPQLQKNPRDRQAAGVINNILQSKYLPPPNVGKSIGHNYKGVRLLGI